MGSSNLHNRQKSADSGAAGSRSLENSLGDPAALQGGMERLSLSDSREGAKTGSSGSRGKLSSNQLRSGGKGSYSHNIEEWIRQTEESAVVPDTIPNEPRDVNSPTFTDTSFGQTVSSRNFLCAVQFSPGKNFAKCSCEVLLLQIRFHVYPPVLNSFNLWERTSLIEDRSGMPPCIVAFCQSPVAGLLAYYEDSNPA